jgi:hypothetical protein
MSNKIWQKHKAFNFLGVHKLAIKSEIRGILLILICHILFYQTETTLSKFPIISLGETESTASNWEIKSPLKISAKAGIQEKTGFRVKPGMANFRGFMFRPCILLKGKYFRPVLFHVHHRPGTLLGFVERFIEPADRGLAIIGPFPFRIGMVNQ